MTDPKPYTGKPYTKEQIEKKAKELQHHFDWAHGPGGDTAAMLRQLLAEADALAARAAEWGVLLGWQSREHDGDMDSAPEGFVERCANRVAELLRESDGRITSEDAMLSAVAVARAKREREGKT